MEKFSTDGNDNLDLYDFWRDIQLWRRSKPKNKKIRTEVATYLRQLADQLDGGGAVTLELGNQRVDLDPVDPLTFKLEAESDWAEGDTQTKQSIEFELVWWQDAQTAEEGSLNIEQTEP